MKILYPLVLTLVIETPIYYLFLKNKSFKNIAFLFLMNLITNITFNAFYIYVFNYNLIYLVIGEILVFILEGLFLYIIKIYKNIFKSFSISLLANIISLAIGLFLNQIIKISSNYLTTYLIILIIIIIIYIVEILLFILRFFKIKHKKINNNTNDCDKE